MNNCEEVSKALAELIAGEKDKAEEKKAFTRGRDRLCGQLSVRH